MYMGIELSLLRVSMGILDCNFQPRFIDLGHLLMYIYKTNREQLAFRI
jgi:hypothetical protein